MDLRAVLARLGLFLLRRDFRRWRLALLRTPALESSEGHVVFGRRHRTAACPCWLPPRLAALARQAGTGTVVSGWAALENFRSPYFSLGAAVLDSEFRADPESGLRIEQSPAGHIESSGLKISRFQQDFSRIQDLTLRFSATAAVQYCSAS